MQLGTLDRSPPPFFRQGYSALTKLIFFTALALFLTGAISIALVAWGVDPIASSARTALGDAGALCVSATLMAAGPRPLRGHILIGHTLCGLVEEALGL